MTPAELDAIVQSHGGIAGSLEVDPYITDETGRAQERNLTPQYKLTFRDGTELTVRPQAKWPDDSGEPDILGWDITNAGTAMKAPSQPSTTSQWSIQAKADGSKVRVNELTGEVAPLEGFEAKPNKPDTFVDQDPITGARVLRDKSTGTIVEGISPSIPGWVPGRGVVPPKEPQQYAPQYPSVITYGNAAYKVDPYTGAVEKVHDFPQPEPTPVDLWKLQNDRETQRIADDQAMARQRMQTQASLTNTFGDQWLRASQWAMPPEWGGTPPGFGADGPYGQLLRMGGSNPQSVQLPQINFDPLNAWRMAQDALGG